MLPLRNCCDEHDCGCIVKTHTLLRDIASATLAFVFLSTTLIVEAQETDKTHRIGFLRSTFSEYRVNYYLPGNLEGFGYVAGKNVEYHDKYAIGTDEQLPKLADELVQLSVDVIVAEGTPAVRAANEATQTIPILMLVEGEPVKAGLVASLTRPGGNVTGVTVHIPGVNRRRLEFLKEIVPGLERVGVLYNATNPEMKMLWDSTYSAAKALGLGLRSLQVTSMDDELEQVFEAAKDEQCNALLVLYDRLIYAIGATRIPMVAKQYRLPVIYPASWYSRNGALITYGPSLFDLNHELAMQVDKVLKGTSPRNIPVERAKTELYIDTDAASAIDLTFPPALLDRADRVSP